MPISKGLITWIFSRKKTLGKKESRSIWLSRGLSITSKHLLKYAMKKHCMPISKGFHHTIERSYVAKNVGHVCVVISTRCVAVNELLGSIDWKCFFVLAMLRQLHKHKNSIWIYQEVFLFTSNVKNFDTCNRLNNDLQNLADISKIMFKAPKDIDSTAGLYYIVDVP